MPETEYIVGVKSLKAAAPTKVARMSFTFPVTEVANEGKIEGDGGARRPACGNHCCLTKRRIHGRREEGDIGHEAAQSGREG